MANGADLILRGVQPAIAAATPVTTFQQGQQASNLLQQQALSNQLLGQQIAQQSTQAPLQQQLLEQQVQAGQTALDRDAFNQTMQTLGQATKLIKPFIAQGDLLGAAGQLGQLERLGVDPEAIEEIRGLISTGDLSSINQQIAAVETINKASLGEGEIIKSSQRLVNIDGQQFSEVDVAQPDGTLETIRTPVGGEVARKTTGLTAEEQAELDIKTTGGKEAAKLASQLKLEPEVKAAVATAVGRAKAAIDAVGEAKDNRTALSVYDTAMNGLTQALGGTLTGPGAGFLPAITANQQIADGAVAAMAPVLKGLFRTAGEGTFTDKDQELLLKMVPTRSDLPESRVSKIKNIDAIVRAKLGQPQSQEPTATDQQPTQNTFTSSTGIQFTVE